MSSSVEDIWTYGLSMGAAALDASTEAAAIEAASALASDLDVGDLKRVATLLAVESVWHARPRRSRRALREWIEMRESRCSPTI